MSAVLAHHPVAAPVSRPRPERRATHLRLITEEEARRIVAEKEEIARGQKTEGARVDARVRLVVRALVAGLAVAAAIALGSLIGLVLRAPVPAAAGTVTVEAGQSLWTVAESVAPAGTDVRDALAAIVELNDLEDAVVVAGQELRVPAP